MREGEERGEGRLGEERAREGREGREEGMGEEVKGGERRGGGKKSTISSQFEKNDILLSDGWLRVCVCSSLLGARPTSWGL